MEYGLEDTNGLYDCIKTLVPSKDVQQKNLNELSLYKSGSGLFDDDFTMLKKSRKTTAPSETLKHFPRSYSKYLNCSKLQCLKLLSLIL